jgi:hypothetical protein
MKGRGEEGEYLHSVLAPAIDGGERSASHLDHCIQAERGSSANWTRGEIGPTAFVDTLE